MPRSINLFESPARLVIGGGIILLFGLAAWDLRISRQEAELVRIDADSAASDSMLMRFAMARGQKIYSQRCADCHGKKGEGDPALGYANLADKDWLYGQGAASEIESVVMYGIRAPHSGTWHLADMPGYAFEHPYPREPTIKPLAPGDIRDLVEYLRAAEGRSDYSDAARRGSKTFQTAGCYDCHGVNAGGDAAIGAPNLIDDLWLYGDATDQSIYDSISRGRAGVCPAWSNRLQAVQIREVVLYVYSLSHT